MPVNILGSVNCWKYQFQLAFLLCCLPFLSTSHARAAKVSRLAQAKHATSSDSELKIEMKMKVEKLVGECRFKPTVDLSYLESDTSQEAGGHTCAMYSDVCMDQNVFILYDPHYSNSANGTNLPSFNVEGLEVGVQIYSCFSKTSLRRVGKRVDGIKTYAVSVYTTFK